MFRLWFMTFFGEYRGQKPQEDHGHSGHGSSGVHESPWVMLAPLVVLAVLSFVGGWVGPQRFERFLGASVETPVLASEYASAANPELATKEEGPSETLLAVVSVGVAGLGLFFAWLLYHKKPQLPQQIADGLGRLYQAVVNKYYIDELYAAIFVKPLVDGSSRILWKGIDQNVIDATLDGSAAGAREVSDSVRHMQSGNLRSYAGWIAAGAAVVIAYMIWMGTR